MHKDAVLGLLEIISKVRQIAEDICPRHTEVTLLVLQPQQNSLSKPAEHGAKCS